MGRSSKDATAARRFAADFGTWCQVGRGSLNGGDDEGAGVFPSRTPLAGCSRVGFINRKGDALMGSTIDTQPEYR
jgi:hypothetical protein